MQIDETVLDLLDRVAQIEIFELQFEFTRANSADIEQAVNQRNYPVEPKIKFFLGFRECRRQAVRKSDTEADG